MGGRGELGEETGRQIRRLRERERGGRKIDKKERKGKFS